MPRLSRRRLLLCSLPTLGLGGAAVRATADAATGHGAHTAAAADAHAGHATFRGWAGRPAGQRLRPPRDPPRLRLRHDAAAAGRTRRCASGALRRRPRRSRSPRGCSSRPGPTTTASPGRRCAPPRASACGSRSSTAPPTSTRSTSTGSTPPRWTGSPASATARSPRGSGRSTSSTPLPFGAHLYHCHVPPLAEHVAKGLYGAFIIDPEGRPREDADELVIVMNGFDTNFDRANEVYAANTVGFAYMDPPIARAQGRARAALRRQRPRVRPHQLLPRARQPLRLLPDRHPARAVGVHGHRDALPGPAGDRSSWRFPHYGRYMFHAHQAEFTELGWQGFFEVCADRNGALVCPLKPDGGTR